MTDYDIFNGDADGICALLQLRLAEPRASHLVTGVKRDITLVEKVSAASGDRLTVLDVSFDKNRQGVIDALNNGAELFYVDHHFAGEIPSHENLSTSINTAANVCTSLLINEHLRGQFPEWAVIGAFGDNLKVAATRIAEANKLAPESLPLLERLGVLINYNAYGASTDDLLFEPAALYKRFAEYATPSAFLEDDSATFTVLDSGYDQDMTNAANAKALFERDYAKVIMLPDATWARRVSGVYGNALANEFPHRAHAVITEQADAGYLVSVRAPLANKTGCDEICRQFPTGGGRKAAAGINDLPVDQLSKFIDTFERFYAAMQIE